MELVHLNIAHRWFIGYDFPEAVPDHSSLSKIRERYGLEVFHQFFEKIVELCAAAGLVWGEELYFDGTKVRANADIRGLNMRLNSIWKHSGDSMRKCQQQKPCPIWLRNTTENR
jgi:transposase